MSYHNPTRPKILADSNYNRNHSGGMGLTGGIVDVGGLCDCLLAINEGRADDSILDLYSEKRMDKYNTVVNPISTANLKRLYESNPDTVASTDQFFQMCHKAASDPQFAKDLNGVSYGSTDPFLCSRLWLMLVLAREYLEIRLQAALLAT